MSSQRSRAEGWLKAWWLRGYSLAPTEEQVQSLAELLGEPPKEAAMPACSSPAASCTQCPNGWEEEVMHESQRLRQRHHDDVQNAAFQERVIASLKQGGK